MPEAVMPRKKTRPGDRPAPSRRLSVQASEEWIAWVEQGAEHCRTDVSKAVDAALAAYFKAQGFEVKPPKRVP